MLFEFDDPRVSGGVVKAPSDINEGKVRGGRGGVCVWWLVADTETIAGEIEQAGGRMVSDVLKEGVNGLYRYFEDPEGNVGVAYQFVGKKAEE
jgi:predicted enzyme related to lactoylglutathione lyase